MLTSYHSVASKPSGQNQTEESTGLLAIPVLIANMAGLKCKILSTSLRANTMTYWNTLFE
jgi:hypothetical protein